MSGTTEHSPFLSLPRMTADARDSTQAEANLLCLAQTVLGGTVAAPSPRAVKQLHCYKQQKEDTAPQGSEQLLGFFFNS